jgi:hypothetical protein
MNIFYFLKYLHFIQVLNSFYYFFIWLFVSDRSDILYIIQHSNSLSVCFSCSHQTCIFSLSLYLREEFLLTAWWTLRKCWSPVQCSVPGHVLWWSHCNLITPPHSILPSKQTFVAEVHVPARAYAWKFPLFGCFFSDPD